MMQDIIEDKFSIAVCAKYEFPALTKFVKFAVLIYIPWWFLVSNAANSPVNDLALVQKISTCSAIDQKCKASALESLGNHLWYLTPELVPLCLFSDDVDTDVKDRIAKAILNEQDEVSSVVCKLL